MEDLPPPVLAPHWPPAGWFCGGVEPRPAGLGPARAPRRLVLGGWGAAAGGPSPLPPGVAGGFGLAAGVLLDEVGARLGLLSDDDVLGHDRSGEPAVADGVQDAVLVLAAHGEVRAVVALARADIGGGAVRAGRVERVAARASLLEEDGAGADGACVLRDVDRVLPEPARGEREDGENSGDRGEGAHAALDHTSLNGGRHARCFRSSRGLR